MSLDPTYFPPHGTSLASFQTTWASQHCRDAREERRIGSATAKARGRRLEQERHLADGPGDVLLGGGRP